MKCKFSYLKFGEIVSIHGGSTCCKVCGSNTQSIVESIQWIYQGHLGTSCLFIPTQIIYCPTCGEKIDGQAENCCGGDDYALPFVSNEIEVPKGGSSC